MPATPKLAVTASGSPFGSVPLADVKLVKNHFEMTVNDVVMTLTAAARHLDRRLEQAGSAHGPPPGFAVNALALDLRPLQLRAGELQHGQLAGEHLQHLGPHGCTQLTEPERLRAEPQQEPALRQQVEVVDRLGQKIVGAGAKAAQAILALARERGVDVRVP